MSRFASERFCADTSSASSPAPMHARHPFKRILGCRERLEDGRGEILQSGSLTSIANGHSFISWSIMIGKNLLKLACEDGHSLQTMVSTYAAWTERATDADVACIRQAMNELACPVTIEGADREHEVAELSIGQPSRPPQGPLSCRGFKPRAARNSSRPTPRFKSPRISWRSPGALVVPAAKAGATR